MGWFLTRKTKSRSRSRTSRRGAGFKTSAASPKPWDPHRTLWGIKLVAIVTAVGLAAIVWVKGDRALRAYINTTHATVIGPEDVELANAPLWMTEAVRMELARAVANHVSDEPLKPSLPAAVAALRRQPWVAGVDRVQRLAGGRIEVYADYRQPLAIIEGRDGYHLVDGDAVALPGLYTWDQAQQLALPIIVGVRSAPPGSPGQAWAGDGVQAALSLVKLLAGEPYFGQIKAFNVGERDARGRIRLVLHTDHGLVRWGLPPGDEGAIEPAATTKLGWLRRVNEARGSIDAGGKVVEVYGASIQLSQPALQGGAPGTSTTTEYRW